MSDPFNLFDGKGVEFEHLQSFHGALQRQKLVDAAQAEQAERARIAALPQCPCCGGRLTGQFELCMHCRSRISWVQGVPCKPGEEEVVRTRIRLQQEHNQQQASLLAAQKLEDAKSSRIGCMIFFSIGIPAIITLLTGIYWPLVIGSVCCILIYQFLVQINKPENIFTRSTEKPPPYQYKCRHCNYQSRDEQEECPRCGR